MCTTHPIFQLSKLIVWGMFGDFKVKATQQTQNSHEWKLCAYDFYMLNMYLQTNLKSNTFIHAVRYASFQA